MRNVMRIEVSPGFRFSTSACRSILIRKPKTIWTAGDNMPHRETAEYIYPIDARTLFVKSVELWDGLPSSLSH